MNEVEITHRCVWKVELLVNQYSSSVLHHEDQRAPEPLREKFYVKLKYEAGYKTVHKSLNIS